MTEEIKYAQPYSVEVSRSTKGVPSWTVKARFEDPTTAVDLAAEMDARLIRHFKANADRDLWA